MRLRRAWVVASKDLGTFRKRKGVFYSTAFFPLALGLGFPAVIFLAEGRTGGIPLTILPNLLDAFSFFFVIGGAILPTAIASYSVLGEKIERSLEPLLATPTTDREILTGKTVAALIPPLLALYLGSALFMASMDRLTVGRLGYLYYPNWDIGLILLVLTPLTALFSVQLNVIISSRINDLRTAQQLGALVVLPFAAVYVGSEIGIIVLDLWTLLAMAGVLVGLDLLMLYGSSAVFNREGILTKWR